MWYGSKNSPNIAKKLQNKSNRLNWKDRLHTFHLARQRKYPSTRYTFQVPSHLNLVVLESTKSQNSNLLFYLFNETYFLTFSVAQSVQSTTYDNQTHSLNFTRFNSSYSYNSYLNALSDVLARFSRPFFVKIKFKGKGYYMYKNKRNTIAPQFGYAHRVYIYSFANSVKFLSKTKVFLFGLSKRDIFLSSYQLFNTRPINVFTGRGVRFARQVVYKKTGKIGAYR
jgi:ribosomal protein L6P/L9E